MKKLFIFFVILYCIGFFIFGIRRGVNENDKNTTNAPAIIRDVSEKPITKQKVISWIPYWDQENAVQSFKTNKDVFDYVSVFWYGLDANGNIRTYTGANEDLSIISFAHQENVKVLAIVANLPDHTENNDWDAKRVNKVIATESARTKHISALITLVKSKDFDGIDIDYEALKKDQRENFSIFTEELADALHREGKILGVAIHPKTGEYIPEEDNGSHAQDLQKIANAADQLYFMTYLEHGTFSQPGSAGSLPWIRRVISYAVSDLHVPKNKVFLGIGLFGLQWKKENDSYAGVNDDMTFGEILSLVNGRNIPVTFDNEAKSAHFSYKENGQEYTIWFENADTVRAKVDLASKFGVGGIAFWRLNNEDPKVWDIFRK